MLSLCSVDPSLIVNGSVRGSPVWWLSICVMENEPSGERAFLSLSDRHAERRVDIHQRDKSGSSEEEVSYRGSIRPPIWGAVPDV